MNIPPNMDEVAKQPFSTEFQLALQAMADTIRRYQDIEEPLARTVLLQEGVGGTSEDPGEPPPPGSATVFPVVLTAAEAIDPTESPTTRWLYTWSRLRPVLVFQGLKWKATGETGTDCKRAINLYEAMPLSVMENVGTGPTLERLPMPLATAGGDGLYDRDAVVMLTRVVFAPFDDAETSADPHDPDHPCVNDVDGETPAGLVESHLHYFYAQNPVQCAGGE